MKREKKIKVQEEKMNRAVEFAKAANKRLEIASRELVDAIEKATDDPPIPEDIAALRDAFRRCYTWMWLQQGEGLYVSGEAADREAERLFPVKAQDDISRIRMKHLRKAAEEVFTWVFHNICPTMELLRFQQMRDNYLESYYPRNEC